MTPCVTRCVPAPGQMNTLSRIGPYASDQRDKKIISGIRNPWIVIHVTSTWTSPDRSLTDRPGLVVSSCQAMSNRSSSMTFVQAATKSATNLARASSLA